MTREEAIRALERADGYVGIHYINGVEEAYINPHLREAVKVALSALRPVSREQVEKVWRGEWNYSHTTETDHFAVVKCSKCGHEAFAIALYVKDENFCPHCGAPMTDEAVEMVVKRMEVLNDAD
jgi:hypothetical protein